MQFFSKLVLNLMTSSLYLLLLITTLFTSITTGLCTNSTDCFNSTLLNVSYISLVQCTDSECVCTTECFLLNSTSGKCSLPDNRCYAYSPSDDSCHSSAPSWLTAVLLSLLVGTTGADNFYINRFEFAIPQLLLFLSPLCGCFAFCSYSACAAFLYSRRNLRHISNCINLMALILASLAAIIFPLTTLSWNLYDIFKIGFNTQLDNNGCVLSK